MYFILYKQIPIEINYKNVERSSINTNNEKKKLRHDRYSSWRYLLHKVNSDDTFSYTKKIIQFSNSSKKVTYIYIYLSTFHNF